MSDEAVHAHNLHKSFVLGTTPVAALQGVEFRVARGEFVCLMGPSGCGKTTLLNMVGGIEVPTRGTIAVDGIDLGRLDDDALADLRRDRIGYVFQFYNLLPMLTARENVETPLALRRVRATERRARALELLETVGLADRADHLPAELSGGEQQRVAIARALANAPALVLLDEPTGDLDSTTGAEVLDLLARLNRDQGITLIVATHDASVAERAGRIVQLRDGRVVDEAPAPAVATPAE